MNDKYQSGISESHRPDLQPNGDIVECIKDMGNDYLIIKSNRKTEPNVWLGHKKHLTTINNETNQVNQM